MKAITLVTMMSLMVTGAVTPLLTEPEKFPESVWEQIPSLPGIELNYTEISELNRRFGQSIAAEKRTMQVERFATNAAAMAASTGAGEKISPQSK
jgi:hypothetical protein